MTLKKLTQDHYIIVDDSEIKEGDLVFNEYQRQIKKFHAGSGIGLCRKITHSTQPLESMNHGNYSSNVYLDIEKLSLQEVKELIGEVDVEKKAHNWSTRQTTRSTDYWKSMVSTYIEAYNQALEDNKEKKYTEMDIDKAISWAINSGRTGKVTITDIDNFIQSLQPKTQWEVEIVDGKLKLK